MESKIKVIDTTASFLFKKFPELQAQGAQVIAVVLGSGFGPFVDELKDLSAIEYSEVPHFPKTTVPGHRGRVCFGFLEHQPLLVLQGRFHLYEGHGLEDVVFPIRILKRLGIQKLVLTNAAGGINPSFRAGDLMMITDHLNLMAMNPLFGPNLAELGPRFPDMTYAYDPKAQELLRLSARKLKMTLREGVYAGCLGPCYETPSEVKMLRTLGADAVGMSTVPETIVARHMDMQVMGISCISNLAAGLTENVLTHEDVVATSKTATHLLTTLLKSTLPEWNKLKN